MIGGADADVVALRSGAGTCWPRRSCGFGDHGMGATAKVAMNLLMGVQLQALAEAVVFGERAGLSRAQLIADDLGQWVQLAHDEVQGRGDGPAGVRAGGLPARVDA